MSVVYLTTLEIVAIHDTLIEVFGGAFGIRDLGALGCSVVAEHEGLLWHTAIAGRVP